jgi:hypothetical protein
VINSEFFSEVGMNVYACFFFGNSFVVEFTHRVVLGDEWDGCMRGVEWSGVEWGIEDVWHLAREVVQLPNPLLERAL